jgi:hypothetical protein
MKSSVQQQPPQGVPVLTEVVVMADDRLVHQTDDEYPPFEPDPAYADTAPAPLIEEVLLAPVPEPTPVALAVEVPASNDEVPAFAPVHPSAPAIDEAALVQRVMADLDRQVDLMFEHRVRETLSPLLARLTDTLVREMRNHLAASLRDVVSRAVSQELDRVQKR